MPDLIRKHPALTVFTIAYTVIAMGVCLAVRNWEFVVYVSQMFVLIAMIMWANQRAQFSTGTLWMLSIWGALHVVGGTLPVPVEMAQVNSKRPDSAVLYALWFIPGKFKYDNFIHAYGFFAATFAVAEALRPMLDKTQPARFALWVILCAAGMGLGALNEVIEYFVQLRNPDTGIGGYDNNMLDLCWNSVGAGAAAGVFVVRRKQEGGEGQTTDKRAEHG